MRFINFFLIAILSLTILSACDSNEDTPDVTMAPDAAPVTLSISLKGTDGTDLLTDDALLLPFAHHIEMQYAETRYHLITKPDDRFGFYDPAVGIPQSPEDEMIFDGLVRQSTADGYRMTFGSFNATTSWTRIFTLFIDGMGQHIIELENKIVSDGGKTRAMQSCLVDGVEMPHDNITFILDDNAVAGGVKPNMVGDRLPESFIIDLVDASGWSLILEPGKVGGPNYWGTDIQYSIDGEPFTTLVWEESPVSVNMLGYDSPSPSYIADSNNAYIDINYHSELPFASTAVMASVHGLGAFEKANAGYYVIIVGSYLNAPHNHTMILNVKGESHKIELDTKLTVPMVRVDGHPMPGNVAKVTIS